MVIGDYQGYAVGKGTPVLTRITRRKRAPAKERTVLSGYDPAVPAAVQNSINPAPYSSFVIIHRADGGFVFNMDECLTDEDDEEHHRVFFYSFCVLYRRLSVHPGCADLIRGRALQTEPACRTARPDPARYYGIPVVSGMCGRVTER